jgi:hypothetical protein
MPRQRSSASKQNEATYRTNLDFDRTVEALRRCPDLEVRHDIESGPPGICYVEPKSKHVIANIGRNGGVDIHFKRDEDHILFLDLLKSKAVYPKGEKAEWVQTKLVRGKTYYMETLVRLCSWMRLLHPSSPIIQQNRNTLERILSDFYENMVTTLHRKIPSKRTGFDGFLKQYEPFLNWLGSNSPGIVAVNHAPQPRIRNGKMVSGKLCVQITVKRKLPISSLHPNSAEIWKVLYNAFMQGEEVRLVDTLGPIGIPKSLAGWPTDIVEEPAGMR